MWVSGKVLDWFKVSQETVNELRSELLVVRAERDAYKQQLTVANANFEWIRLRVNQLEIERGGLLEKATGIKTVVPEIVRTPSNVDQMVNNFTFDDVGDEMAKRLGLPLFDS